MLRNIPTHRCTHASLLPTCLWLGLLVGILGHPATAQDITVQDIALETGFQDDFGGNFKRGRALVAADFDLDGLLDFYMGNPGDESFIIRNAGTLTAPSYERVQTIVTGELAWGAAAADYDNDGDYDLYLSIGANEGVGHDFLFQNRLVEEGTLRFIDVTAEAGISGPVPIDESDPIPVASANGVWGDYDRDGDVDLFVSVNIWRGGVMDEAPDVLEQPVVALNSDLLGRNVLWRNEGDGTFTDVTDVAGLGTTRYRTRHSTFLDVDNDGDLDLFENNNGGPNVLWRNLLVETGTTSFEDATAALSLEGEDLSFPFGSFASCASDFNNDGWEDLIAFNNGRNENDSPYPPGHAVFLNQGGIGFENVAAQALLNNPFQPMRGVMGCQVGDLNGDGTPDVYIGNGGPSGGQNDQLYLSTSGFGEPLLYENRTGLIDFPAPEKESLRYPSYPYRTHGTNFVDVDGDGTLEIAVINGGPAIRPNSVREPNRLFKFTWPEPLHAFRVRLIGDGLTVSRDAIGARLRLQVRGTDGQQRALFRTLYGGQCFSAQHGFWVHFLLQEGDQILNLNVQWPDGTRHTFTGLTADRSYRAYNDGSISDGVLAVELAALRALTDGPDVTLQWQTLTETNNAGFEVQLLSGARDDDAASPGAWEPVTFIKGMGTTTEKQHYQYRVAGLGAGQHHFRLKQVDLDGTSTYSSEVEVSILPTEGYQLSPAYPNPFNPETRFTLSVAQDQIVRVAVYDMLGREVARLHDGVVPSGVVQPYLLAADTLPSGLYLIRATGETFTTIRSVTLVR